MLTREQLLTWLQETEPERLRALWDQADATRRAHVGDAVHLRGLVELSNYCTRLCTYCGVRAPNHDIRRYRMTADEVLACAHQAVALGFGTVVLQAGEDFGLTTDGIAGLIRRIKRETALAITLSLGERTPRELELWREAGADRYLLRFETSNSTLFDQIHPPRAERPTDRVGLLRVLRALDYELGSGVMIGIPGQTYDDLVADIELFRELDLDMIGVGPYLPHPDTPLGKAARGDSMDVGDTGRAEPSLDPSLRGRGVPGDALMTHKTVALARLVCPSANIPSTTALATLGGPEEQLRALQRGANVIMPNLTPQKYRQCYQIYPDKACYYDSTELKVSALHARIAELGRMVGTGRGDSPNRRQAVAGASDSERRHA